MQRMFFRALAAAVLIAASARPGRAEPAPVVIGPAETVFDWSEDRCERWDIPDTPARAWRGDDGRVRLVAGSERSRASVGPDLDRLARDCAVLHQGAGADDPAAYDDRVWLHATFTDGGSQVLALAHDEYHGHRRPERCPAGGYMACWSNTILELVSTDGGRSFAPAEGVGFVAGPAARYTGAAGRRIGYFNPSNILERDGWLYAFVFAERDGPQRRGPCLMRRPAAAGAADWRAWDGVAFAVRFADPYREAVSDPAAHACAPLAPLTSTISSVVRHMPSGRYLAVTPATLRGGDGVTRSGIWWTTSVNLLAWSPPKLLWEIPLLWRRDCAAPAAYAYPSLLDPASGSANFDTVGAEFWLYLVRMPLDGACRVGPERDLVRLRISWPA